MNGARIRALIKKDWLALSGDRALIVTSVGVPLLIVGVFLLLAVIVPAVEDLDLGVFPASRLEDGRFSPSDLTLVLLLRSLLLLLLMIPEIATMAIAAHSIVGEKRERSLEPLLATPITTGELLTAKCLAAGIPGVLLTWALFLLSAIALAAFVPPSVHAEVFDGMAFLLVLLIAPLIAVLALSLAILASARASDAHSAQQIGVVIIVPLIALLIGQIGGFYFLDSMTVLVAAVALAGIDFVVLRAGVRFFGRESILTRWR